MRRQEPRSLLCSGKDAGAVQLGWKGRKDRGSIPEAASQGAQLRVRHTPCREAGLQELSLAS